MRRFLFASISWLALGCSSEQFTTATRSGLGDGGPGTGGGSNTGGSTGGGGRGNGGSAAGGSAATGGTNAGGTSGGGTTGNGGSTSNGGASAGGVVGNGGTSAGGIVGNGGTSAGGVVGNGGTSAGGVVGTGGVSAGGVVGTGGIVGNGGTASRQSGDCTIGMDDCHNGTTCVEVTPGGYRVCAVKYPEANGCSPAGGCCQSSDCPGGATCFPSPIAPSCSGVVIIDGNVCASDQCSSDSACGSAAICAPAGTFMRKVRMCVQAACRRDTDCTMAPGGICAPVSGGCCDIPYGLYCVYPNKGCRSNADCPTGNCALDPQGFSVCSTTPLICPL